MEVCSLNLLDRAGREYARYNQSVAAHASAAYGLPYLYVSQKNPVYGIAEVDWVVQFSVVVLRGDITLQFGESHLSASLHAASFKDSGWSWSALGLS
jgi:hypothetical protein